MCLVLRNKLIFEILVEEIGICGREDLFFSLHQILLEKQDLVEVQDLFLSSPTSSGFAVKT